MYIKKIGMRTVNNSHVLFALYQSVLYKGPPNSVKGPAGHRLELLQALGMTCVQVVHNVIDGIGLINCAVIFFRLCKIGSAIRENRGWSWNGRYMHPTFRKIRLQILAVAIIIVVEEEHSIHNVSADK
jgi:hypothetical protein